MLKKILGLSFAFVLALTLVSSADAAVLKNARLTMTNPVGAASGVNHSFNFYHPGNTIGAAQFQYCREASGTCTAVATFAGLASATITPPGGGSDLGNWGAASYNGAQQRIELTRSSVNSSATGLWTFAFDNIQNPAIGDCNLSSNSSTGTCYVRIRTYTDTSAATLADTTTVSFTVTQAVQVTATVDPSFTLIISGINPTQTATANTTTLTAAVTSTVTTIPFGNLTPGTPKFAGQSLTVTTNAVGGYSITARMSQNMTGSAYGGEIDQFNAAGVAQNTTSVAWSSPNGTATNDNSGWLGIGTDDTGVTGRGNNQFFPLGTTAQTIASINQSAQNRMSIVAVGIEVNAFQQADSYSGNLRYNALPVY